MSPQAQAVRIVLTLLVAAVLWYDYKLALYLLPIILLSVLF